MIKLDRRPPKPALLRSADMRERGEEASDLPPQSGIPDIQTFIRGYGATQPLESGDAATARVPDAKKAMPISVRIANLFDPRACVIDAEPWLLGLTEEAFKGLLRG